MRFFIKFRLLALDPLGWLNEVLCLFFVVFVNDEEIVICNCMIVCCEYVVSKEVLKVVEVVEHIVFTLFYSCVAFSSLRGRKNGIF